VEFLLDLRLLKNHSEYRIYDFTLSKLIKDSANYRPTTLPSVTSPKLLPTNDCYGRIVGSAGGPAARNQPSIMNTD
jgi:hypothetical protein